MENSVAIKKSAVKAKLPEKFETMGTVRCEGCGEEFLIAHHAGNPLSPMVKLCASRIPEGLDEAAEWKTWSVLEKKHAIPASSYISHRPGVHRLTRAQTKQPATAALLSLPTRLHGG